MYYPPMMPMPMRPPPRRSKDKDEDNEDNTKIIILVVVIAAVGFYFYMQNQKNKETPPKGSGNGSGGGSGNGSDSGKGSGNVSDAGNGSDSGNGTGDESDSGQQTKPEPPPTKPEPPLLTVPNYPASVLDDMKKDQMLRVKLYADKDIPCYNWKMYCKKNANKKGSEYAYDIHKIDDDDKYMLYIYLYNSSIFPRATTGTGSWAGWRYGKHMKDPKTHYTYENNQYLKYNDKYCNLNSDRIRCIYDEPKTTFRFEKR